MSEDDSIDSLLALGFLALVGFGAYKVIKSFSSFKRGEEITEDELVDKGYYSESEEEVDDEEEDDKDNDEKEVEPCENCGDPNPERFKKCGHCKSCHGACYRCEDCLTCNGCYSFGLGDLCERCDREAHDSDD